MCKIYLRPRVCIIDADIEVIDILTLLLRKREIDAHGYRNISTFKKNESLQNIACLLLEINLPENDSLAFLAEIKDSKFVVPTIVTSSESDIATAVSAMKNNAIDFIEKPIIYNLLVSQLESIVRLPASDRRPHYPFS